MREENTQLRLLTDQTTRLMEQILKDKKQFRRHFVKVKGDTDTGQEERVYKKVDTKALKEFVSALRELKELLGQEDREENSLRVVFEAGEDAFNA